MMETCLIKIIQQWEDEVAIDTIVAGVNRWPTNDLMVSVRHWINTYNLDFYVSGYRVVSKTTDRAWELYDSESDDGYGLIPIACS